MDKNKQSMRLSDSELELLKNTFADREELLIAVRNFFYCLPLDEKEKKQLNDTISKNENLKKLIRKQLLPEFQNDLPLGQSIDLWQTLDIKDVEKLPFIIESRGLLIDMMEDRLNDLNNALFDKDVDINYWIGLKDNVDKSKALVARNEYLAHIDRQLMVIKVLSGLKDETVEQTKNRLLRDSSK